MSVRTNLYENNTDYCWFDSSNVIYSECIDKENELKTLYVVFKNKTGIVKYRYDEIDVNDYLMFRTSLSQGKALNQFLKKYKYQKLEDAVNENELSKREQEIWLKRQEELENAENGENKKDTQLDNSEIIENE